MSSSPSDLVQSDEERLSTLQVSETEHEVVFSSQVPSSGSGESFDIVSSEPRVESVESVEEGVVSNNPDSQSSEFASGVSNPSSSQSTTPSGKVPSRSRKSILSSTKRIIAQGTIAAFLKRKMSTSISVCGKSLKLSSTERSDADLTGVDVLVDKAARRKLDMDKLCSLMNEITKPQQMQNFCEISMQETNPDKLKATYNIQQSLLELEQHHLKYDLADVFMICTDPTNGSKAGDFRDLYCEYHLISIDQVAESNEWYRKWVHADEFESINENLLWSYTHLKNHIGPNFLKRFDHEYLADPTYFRPTI